MTERPRSPDAPTEPMNALVPLEAIIIPVSVAATVFMMAVIGFALVVYTKRRKSKEKSLLLR